MANKESLLQQRYQLLNQIQYYIDNNTDMPDQILESISDIVLEVINYEQYLDERLLINFYFLYKLSELEVTTTDEKTKKLLEITKKITNGITKEPILSNFIEQMPQKIKPDETEKLILADEPITPKTDKIIELVITDDFIKQWFQKIINQIIIEKILDLSSNLPIESDDIKKIIEDIIKDIEKYIPKEKAEKIKQYLNLIDNNGNLPYAVKEVITPIIIKQVINLIDSKTAEEKQMQIPSKEKNFIQNLLENSVLITKILTSSEENYIDLLVEINQSGQEKTIKNILRYIGEQPKISPEIKDKCNRFLKIETNSLMIITKQVLDIIIEIKNKLDCQQHLKKEELITILNAFKETESSSGMLSQIKLCISKQQSQKIVTLITQLEGFIKNEKIDDKVKTIISRLIMHQILYTIRTSRPKDIGVRPLNNVVSTTLNNIVDNIIKSSTILSQSTNILSVQLAKKSQQRRNENLRKLHNAGKRNARTRRLEKKQISKAISNNEILLNYFADCMDDFIIIYSIDISFGDYIQLSDTINILKNDKINEILNMLDKINENKRQKIFRLLEYLINSSWLTKKEQNKYNQMIKILKIRKKILDDAYEIISYTRKNIILPVMDQVIKNFNAALYRIKFYIDETIIKKLQTYIELIKSIKELCIDENVKKLIIQDILDCTSYIIDTTRENTESFDIYQETIKEKQNFIDNLIEYSNILDWLKPDDTKLSDESILKELSQLSPDIRERLMENLGHIISFFEKQSNQPEIINYYRRILNITTKTIEQIKNNLQDLQQQIKNNNYNLNLDELYNNISKNRRQFEFCAKMIMQTNIKKDINDALKLIRDLNTINIDNSIKSKIIHDILDEVVQMLSLLEDSSNKNLTKIIKNKSPKLTDFLCDYRNLFQYISNNNLSEVLLRKSQIVTNVVEYLIQNSPLLEEPEKSNYNRYLDVITRNNATPEEIILAYTNIFNPSEDQKNKIYSSYTNATENKTSILNKIKVDILQQLLLDFKIITSNELNGQFTVEMVK